MTQKYLYKIDFRGVFSLLFLSLLSLLLSLLLSSKFKDPCDFEILSKSLSTCKLFTRIDARAKCGFMWHKDFFFFQFHYGWQLRSQFCILSSFISRRLSLALAVTLSLFVGLVSIWFLNKFCDFNGISLLRSIFPLKDFPH